MMNISDLPKISTKEEIETNLLNKCIFGIRENNSNLFCYYFDIGSRQIKCYNYNNPNLSWNLDYKKGINKLYERGPYFMIDDYYINTDENFKDD